MIVYNQETREKVTDVLIMFTRDEARTLVEMAQTAVAQRKRKSPKWTRFLAELDDKVCVF